mmetsp:Transcript_15797/g.18277  ORF Transcript_15797/g.18277 Transcript_15797/m.18277 type:complete len:94 (+) Transcript_15797:533-814(+)
MRDANARDASARNKRAKLLSESSWQENHAQPQLPAAAMRQQELFKFKAVLRKEHAYDIEEREQNQVSAEVRQQMRVHDKMSRRNTKFQSGSKQ